MRVQGHNVKSKTINMLIIKPECIAKVFESAFGGLLGVELFNQRMLHPGCDCRHPGYERALLIVNNDPIDFIRAC